MKYLYPLLFVFLTISFGYGQQLKTPTLSPFSTISQEIGLTKVTLEYSRPSAKERIIFGNLVPYNKIWRTGANASTKITLQESAKIANQYIEAGTYAIYTIPRKEIWTIIIHSNTKLRSLSGKAYNPQKDVFRFTIKPITIDKYVETFTIQFTDLKSNSLNLQMLWENTLVSIPIEFEVDSKIEKQMAAFLKNPETISPRTYFEVAQYYSNNDKDLNDALIFINKALYKSPQNFRYGLLKAKILEKNGDHRAALAAVKTANKWAKNKNNDNYIEQTRLFWQQLLNKK
ncbi:MAG: Uncharacterised protein [Flavobacterium sp. SCGC AAA160-P02]|nr:MAG: Uncharacterised protein [Flavobacterium sp. SCGC AAA160-P02]